MVRTARNCHEWRVNNLRMKGCPKKLAEELGKLGFICMRQSETGNATKVGMGNNWAKSKTKHIC
jgi:hypothetical protein